jgi:2-dehydropantoate 2-reductase
VKIAVVGAGGVGGYFGARLAAGGEDVWFVARGAHLVAMRTDGLRVRSIFGDLALRSVETRVTDDPASIGPVDVVLFAVKSYDTETAAAATVPLIGSETAVVSLQNGIDNEEKIAAIIGPGHVVGGAAYIFAGIGEPGEIRHTGGPARLVFGELDGRTTARLEAFLAACRRAGIDADLVPDIDVALWTKYAFICAQAGLTAATGSPIGTIRECPPTWALFEAVLAEAVAVGRAEGVPLADELVERQLATAANLAPGMFSSLYNDLVGGRRMELEALLGELARRAAKLGVPAPVTSTLYAVLLPQAASRPSSWSSGG